MAPTIRCLAVDDHPSVLEGLARIFADTEGIELAAVAGSGEAALEDVVACAPAVAIVDVRMPGIDGVTTVRRLAEHAPDVTPVMFSAYGDRRLLSDAIAAGARGYVLKCSPPGDLLRAVRAAAGGAAFVDPTLSPSLLMDAGAKETPLAEREREILRLLAEGLHTEDVATHIGVSTETVKADTKRAMLRLGAHGRVHAVANAVRSSLIE